MRKGGGGDYISLSEVTAKLQNDLLIGCSKI